jgi:hypothetical protein
MADTKSADRIRRQMLKIVWACIPVCICPTYAVAEEDAYLAYLHSAAEFQPVPHHRDQLIGQWDTWLYMPWRYRWTIGTGTRAGEFCREFGIQGAFTDHGQGPFDWLNQWNLRFYNDHTAAKGYLYLRGANQKRNFVPYQHDARSIRSGTDGAVPIDDALLQKLQRIITQNITRVRQNSDQCVAYALDDEISWGAFVVPIPWRLNDDDAAYAAWLREYYGSKDCPQPQFVTPDFTHAQLNRPLKHIDLSPLLDRITYNDSLWAILIGRLVETANQVAPDTPCGFVGGQAPNMWGGFDYAKLMKKIQFIEAYDLGSAQEIIRSFNPDNLMPQVTTHFHRDSRGVDNDIWQAWYHFAHGNRGMIGWVEDWFEQAEPRPWLREFRPTLREISEVQGSKLVGAKWLHDGVAIYYSHPSIQVSWCLDSQTHGRTWGNRGNDHRLGTSHNVRRAWEYLLTDSGIQYNFISYRDVAVQGVPDKYQVLILPACYALSDIEAQRITEFCVRGGTVIADFACGLFDQHGRGRDRGALDDLFGIHHDGTKTCQDLFAARLWVETDQDAGYQFSDYRQLFATLPCKLQNGYSVAEAKQPTNASRAHGQGEAVYLNLSPQRYLQYRQEGTADAATRRTFVAPIQRAGIRPRLSIEQPADQPRLDLETTYWQQGNRTILFVVQNVPIRGTSRGGEGGEGLVRQAVPLQLRFNQPVKQLIDERTGEDLGSGRRFQVTLDSREAVMLSYEQ